MKLNSWTAIFWIVSEESLTYKIMFYAFGGYTIFCVGWLMLIAANHEVQMFPPPIIMLTVQFLAGLFFWAGSIDFPGDQIKKLLGDGADIELEKAHAKEILAILGKPELDRAQPSAALRTYLDAMISETQCSLDKLKPSLPEGLTLDGLAHARHQKFAVKDDEKKLTQTLRGLVFLRKNIHMAVTVCGESHQGKKTIKGILTGDAPGGFTVELDGHTQSSLFLRDGTTNRWVCGDLYFELP